MKQLWMGGSGAVTLEGALVETLFQSGGNVSVKVRVKNDTKRRVQGLKVSITQRLLILANKIKKEVDQVKVIGDTVSEEWFKNKDFVFDCGEDRSTIVHINVPKNVRTIRNTALFEVVCYVVVSLYLGPFTKDLSVQLPVYIAHSASLQPPPLTNTDLNHFPNHYNMMDESADFFIEDIRQDDNEILEYVPSPVSIPPKKGTRVLPWTNGEDEGYHGHHSPRSSFGSGVFGSASPKKLGSLASSFLGRPKQMSPSSPSKLIAKSPPLAPASPYAYIPAIQRVRYLSFSTQEQSEIQKRPYTPPPRSALGSGANGFGVHSGSQTSEYELNVSPPPTKIVQKWLEHQNTNNLSDSSSTVTPPLSEPAEQCTTSAASPWSHINRTQEIMSVSPKSQSKKPVSQGPISIPVQNTSKLPDSTFQRSNSIVSSPPGPSGLTLLIKQGSLTPSVLNHTFEENPPEISGDTVLGGKNLPREDEEESIVIIDEDNIPKSDFLQVPPLTSGGAIGNLSALLRWGGSWIGYGNEGPDSNQGDHNVVTTNNNNQNEEINDESSHKVLPLHPEYATNTKKARAIRVDEVMNIVQNSQSIFGAEVGSEILDDGLVKGRPKKILPPPPEDATNTKKARAIKVNEIINISKNGQDFFDAEIESEILDDGLVKGRPKKILPPPPEDATNTKKARAIKVNEIINIAKNGQDFFDAEIESEIPDDGLVKGRSKKTLPPPPEDATNTKKARAIKVNEIINIAKNGQDIFGVEMVSTDNQVTRPVAQEIQQCRPRRNLPPILPKSPPLKSSAPINIATYTDDTISKSKAISATVESEVVLSSILADATSKTNAKPSSPPIPPKPLKLSTSPPIPPKPSRLVSSPPKPLNPTAMTSNQNAFKASIFASLGQKKLGPTDYNAVPSPVVQGGRPGNVSPPSKQTGFNVPRKPVSQNNIMNVEERDMNINKFGNGDDKIESKDNIVVDVSKASTLTDNVPSIGSSPNVNSDEISLAPPKFEESKDTDKDPFGEIIIPSELISASPPKKTSIPTPISTTNLTRKKTFSQHKLKPMLPTLPQTILTNPNNENIIIEEETVNNETSKFSSSPISQYSKITSTPTTYVNTTIAKPIVIAPLLQKNNDIDGVNNKTALKKSRKNKKLRDGDNDESSLVDKIVEPPKQVLSPRLQDYINKYNKATYGGD